MRRSFRASRNLEKYGIFAEPAGAAAYMGLVKAASRGMVDETDPVVVVNTGNGLKDIRAAMMSVREAPVIEPSLASLKKYLKK
jgi:threonine synthase